jgi:hypothetical protein
VLKGLDSVLCGFFWLVSSVKLLNVDKLITYGIKVDKLIRIRRDY